MDTVLSGLTTADLPADMQAPALRETPRPSQTIVMPTRPLVRCDHGWLVCDECDQMTR